MPRTAVDKLLEEVKLKKGEEKAGYVSVVPSPAHAAALHRWATRVCKIRFGVPKNEYHATLMYDTRNKVGKKKAKGASKGRLFKAEFVNVALLGKRNDVLALELHSPDLAKRHEQLKKLGFKHSYKNFLPHVTLKESKTTRSDFVSASANLSVLLDILPEMAFYRETWDETRD